jgi:hypothetical protein
MEAGQKEALLSEFPHLKSRVHLLSYVVEQRSYNVPDPLNSEQEARGVIAELDSLIQCGCDSIFALAENLNQARLGTGL